MQLNEKLGAVEAIIFAMGDPVDDFRIAEAAEVEPEKVSSLVKMLNDRYSESGSALKILRLGGGYQLSTRTEYADYIRAAMENKRQTPLSNAAMEALTIVAYNQPVTKGFVESVRGIDSSSVVNSLVEKGLLEEDSRLDVPGHPVAYRTTAAFLRCFGLASLDDLPPLVRENEEAQRTLFENEITADDETEEDS
ncbi:MAG: SMC-Scp complex subunit ScpB [Porcipelethomonas sp.]